MTLSTLNDAQVRSLSRLAVLVCVLAIAYLSFASLDELPGSTNDKLGHFLAFGVLAWLADRSYPGRRLEPHRWTLLLGYGLMIELVQGFLPFRDLSLLDFAADAAGIFLYSLAPRIRYIFKKSNVFP